MSILKTIILPNVFVLFFYYIYWDRHLMSISIAKRYCNRFIHRRTIEDRYFLWISAVPLCFWNPDHIHWGCGHACVAVTISSRQSSTLQPVSDHCYSMLLLFRQPITYPIIVFISVPSTVLVQTQLQSIKSSRKTAFLSIGQQHYSFIFLVVFAQWL